MEWQPIETAEEYKKRKDGKVQPILAYWPDRYAWPVDAWWTGTEWRSSGDEAEVESGTQPTHWMPLPSPPSSTAKE